MTIKTGPIPIISQRQNHPKVQIPNASQSHIKTFTTSNCHVHYAPPSSNNSDPGAEVDQTSVGKILQKLAHFQGEFHFSDEFTILFINIRLQPNLLDALCASHLQIFSGIKDGGA